MYLAVCHSLSLAFFYRGENMITNMKEYMKKYREEHKKRIAELSKIRYDRWLKKNKGKRKYIQKLI